MALAAVKIPKKSTVVSRKIIHCDADCFFVALEMRDDARLRHVPVAVGGDPNRRGVISTCNYEARRFGVHSAMASAYAKKLCPSLIIIPHHMDKYREASQRMNEIFTRYTNIIEPLSMDEAFLDVSGINDYNGSATLMAQSIREQIKREVGITVSAGVAPNKFLAKVASDWQKPDGLTVITPSQVTAFTQQLPVTCIPGVGQQTRQKLHAQGLYQCADLLSKTERDLVQDYGKFGRRLYQLSRGDDERPVNTSRQRKSMSVEHTVERDLSPEDCTHILCSLYDKLDKRLSQLDVAPKIKKVFIKVKFMDLKHTSDERCCSTIALDP